MIHDQGVSKEFRGRGTFPASCPESKVDAWVEANAESYDFNRSGWPAWYPTRTLKDWEEARVLWEPHVFRGPTEDVPPPRIGHSKKKRKKSLRQSQGIR